MNKKTIKLLIFIFLMALALLALALLAFIQLFGRLDLYTPVNDSKPTVTTTKPSDSTAGPIKPEFLQYIQHCLNETTPSGRDDCVIAAAVNHSIPELCQNVSGLKSDACYYDLARKEMNVSYCELIQRGILASACRIIIEHPPSNYSRVLNSSVGFSDDILVVDFITEGVGDLRAAPFPARVELGVEEPGTVDDLQVLSLYCGNRKVFDVKDGEGGFALVDVPPYGSTPVRKTLLVGNYSCSSASRLSFKVLSSEDALKRNLTITVLMTASSGGGV